MVVGRHSYWEFERDPDKPFGLVQTTTGRGTMSTGVPFSPEEDQDGFYPQVKYHLLAALEEWAAKGWLSTEELSQIGVSIRPAAPQRPLIVAREKKPKRLSATEQRRALIETAGAALSSAREAVQELHDDLEERRSNMEERFSSTERYSRFEQAGSDLEEISSSIEELESSIEGIELP
mgnify:CR=1 FL=1